MSDIYDHVKVVSISIIPSYYHIFTFICCRLLFLLLQLSLLLLLLLLLLYIR